jgi:ligand-binding sensor domain-containing protein
MPFLFRFAPLLLSIIVCFCSRSHEPFFPVPGGLVYNLQYHGDSIYFSTLEEGVFRFPPDHPETVKRIGRKGMLPIRSLAFGRDGRLYAGSYADGVHYLDRDTLLPFRAAPERAWSLKFDDEGTMWIAGSYGIFRVRRDSLERFCPLHEAHDVAVTDSVVVAAYANGIAVFTKDKGQLVREYCKGVNFWSITRYDSIIVGGGLNLCAVISGNRCTTVPLGNSRNFIWGSARDSTGAFYLATQQGLYVLDEEQRSVNLVGYKGTCIKSILFDKKGRLWVGRYNGKDAPGTGHQ